MNNEEHKTEMKLREKALMAMFEQKENLERQITWYNEICKMLDTAVYPRPEPQQTIMTIEQQKQLLYYNAVRNEKERIEDAYLDTGR